MGTALHASDLRTDGTLFLNTTTITGTGDEEVVNLHDAHIGAHAQLTGTQLRNSSGPLLTRTEAQVGATFYLPIFVVCLHGHGLDIGGKQTCPGNERRMAVRGLVLPQLGHGRGEGG